MARASLAGRQALVAAAFLGGCTSGTVAPFTPAPVEAGVDGYVYVPVEAGPSDADAALGPGPDVEGPEDTGPFTFLDVPFMCGGKSCPPSTYYCLHVLPEGGLTPEAGDISDRCLPIPGACATTLTCQCLETVAPCDAGLEGEGCIEGAGLEVSCPAGT